MPRQCVWCVTPDATEEPADPERELCLDHRAELYGVSVNELRRGEAIEAAEWADVTGR